MCYDNSFILEQIGEKLAILSREFMYFTSILEYSGFSKTQLFPLESVWMVQTADNDIPYSLQNWSSDENRSDCRLGTIFSFKHLLRQKFKFLWGKIRDMFSKLIHAFSSLSITYFSSASRACTSSCDNCSSSVNISLSKCSASSRMIKAAISFTVGVSKKV
jgi:hypothetical protein